MLIFFTLFIAISKLPIALVGFGTTAVLKFSSPSEFYLRLVVLIFFNFFLVLSVEHFKELISKKFSLILFTSLD